MIHRLITLSLCSILSYGTVANPNPLTQSSALLAESQKGVVSTNIPTSLFRFKDGLLSGNAQQENLSSVLSELGRIAKLKPVLRYKPTADEGVSFKIKDKLLADVLKEVLRNYNYIYIPASEGSDGLSKLILLGKMTTPANFSVPNIEQKLIQEQQEETPTNSENVTKKKLSGPWGLDEFRRLKEFCKPIAEANEHGNPLATVTDECQELEALEREDKLARALDALDTNHRNLKEAALDELKGINDPEATNALLNMAMNEDDKELQQLAAEALWQHAADLGFNNLEANQALKDLTNADNTFVNDIGQKAVEDAKRYAKHTKKDGGG